MHITQYQLNHIWNLDETCVQVGQQFGARVLANQASQDVYSTIPKSQEWLVVNCVVNATSATLLA